MTKYLLAAAAVAAIGFAGTAYAGSATAPKAMSDSEMDAVTAAGGPPTNPGEGVLTACDVRGFSVCSVKVIDNPQGIKEVGVGRCSSGRCASDIRLKRDIKQVARLDNGLALYRYRYKWSDQVYVGVMAQEVLLVRPDAVVRGADGYLRVDYSRLGLHLMTGEEWVASRFETAQNATTTATPPKVMSDAEMDKVTAGTIHPGQGLGTASSTGNNGFINGFNNGLNPHAFPNAQSPGPAGNGLCTAKLICP